MNYNQVQINKVDNGYIVSTTKVNFGDPKPEQTAMVYTDFADVVKYLQGT